MNKADQGYCLSWAKKIRATKYLGGKCSKCGDNNIFHIEFHHLDASRKESNVNALIKSNSCWDIIKNEIDKCILVCRNCHTKIHDPRYNELKSKLLEIKGDKQCSMCGYNECTAALDFHHLDEEKKSFRISRGYRENRWKIPLEKLVAEMDKCVVVCRNCHVVKHIDTNRFESLKEEIYKRADYPRTRQPEVDREQMWKLHKEGVSGRDIAKRLHCVPSTVCDALKKMKMGAD